MQFQRAEVAGAERGLQHVLALGQLREDGARLVLAATAPDRGADDADQRRRVKRPLDEGDVAQDLPERAPRPDCAPVRRPGGSAA